MRTNIVHIGATELNYEIRQIVEVAYNVAKLSGKPICWENIGDPVQKGERIPDWMKRIIIDSVSEDSTYAYSPTKGLLETREFLAAKLNARGGAQITAEDILFFNGLGDAVSKVYGYLAREARVIGPSPAYPTHSSAEAAHSGSAPITYRLDPNNSWMPDLEELRNKVKYNETIAGIMIINPDNPTGVVFPKEVMQEIVAIAKEYDLFLVADEIYMNLTYNGKGCTPLAEVVGEVPGISLKGISKELPWPGGRCGWMEVYNQKKSPHFQKYIKSILDAKMLEVSSTTLPQTILPKVYSHPEFKKFLQDRRDFYERRSKLLGEIFSGMDEVICNPPDGAFYFSLVFKGLKEKMSLHVPNADVRSYIEQLCPPGTQPDRKFVYQLLGAKQICVVPLSSFVCDLQGFRMTLLERNDEKFESICKGIRSSIQEFTSSV